MPGALPQKNDDYICTQIPLPNFKNRIGYVTKFKAIVNESVHHIILSGCDTWMEGSEAKIPGPCDGQCKTHILYSWAHQGAPLTLPEDASYAIGRYSRIKSLSMEVHYIHPLKEPDYATIEMEYSWDPTEFQAGILLMYNSEAIIPANTEHFATNVSCRLHTPVPIYVVGIRTHSHALNKGVLGYYQHLGENKIRVLAKGTAQWPQTFYHPTQLQAESDFVRLDDGDLLLARCVMDSSGRDRITYMGSTYDDEMCNLYLMYIMDANYQLPEGSQICADDAVEGAWDNPPRDSFNYVTGAPPSAVTSPTHTTTISFQMEPDFYIKDFHLGQTSGVASMEENGKTQLFILQRGANIWDELSFSDDNIYQVPNTTYVKSPILQVDPETGRIINRFGENLLILPHGLSVEKTEDGNPKALWLTDTALHQVMRFKWGHWDNPNLILGHKMQPGNDRDSFCQPTDVAVASTGDVFIADGYCNQRIMKVSQDGEYLDEWPLEGKQIERRQQRNRLSRRTSAEGFQVVHSITIIPPEDGRVEQVCAADRERGQVVCYDLDGFKIVRYAGRDLSPSVFAIAYSTAYNQIFGVTGVDGVGDVDSVFNLKLRMLLDEFAGDQEQEIRAHTFAFSPFQLLSENEEILGGSVKRFDDGESVLDIEGLSEAGLSRPHDIDISPDGLTMFIAELKAPFITKVRISKSND